jgi:hypothetical protein
MSKVYRVIFVILSLLVGATFLYSAYTKLFPIYPFEYTMVEFIHLPWILAGIAARAFTGLEMALGTLIALHLFGKNKWILKLSFVLLIVFSIYLVGLWITVGNNVNCGCFGDAIWMSPAASLVKNAVLLLVIGLLIRFHNGLEKRWTCYLVNFVLIASVALPFLLFPIPSSQPSWLNKDRYQFDYSAIRASNNSPQVQDLTKGKHIIAFLSASCPHCRIAAYKMHLMKLKNPSIPFFMIIGGSSSLADFWKASKSENIPYMRLAKEPFLRYTGGVFPLIIWVNDGWVEAKADYNTLSQAEIEKWLNGK